MIKRRCVFDSSNGSSYAAEYGAVGDFFLMRDKFTTAREIAKLNIEHYGKLLQTPLDEQTRRTVKELLEVEMAKLVSYSDEKER
jgi:hypothetical protein